MRVPPVPRTESLMKQATTQTPGQASVAITSRFIEVVKGFPNFDELDPFTKAMTRTVIDHDSVKHALGRLHGSQRMLKRFAHLPKKEFLGRLKSLLAKLHEPLQTLHHARLVLRRIPDPTVSFTLCLAGFPNAGKSTLLKKLTGAKAQIADYSFTTKNLNYGTTSVRYHDIQVVDTPGTLNRLRANAIERQALLALKHLAKAIVFVYDPLREADDQEKLFETVFAYDVPVAIYAAKQDIVAQLPVFREAKQRSVPVFTTAGEVLGWLEPLVLTKENA